MENNMRKLQHKMLVLILVPTLLFFIGMTLYISLTVNNVMMENADEILQAHGEKLSADLGNELERSYFDVESVSSSLQGIIEKGDSPKRDTANIMLQKILERNPNALSVWMFWEENAFDGKDKEYANRNGY